MGTEYRYRNEESCRFYSCRRSSKLIQRCQISVNLKQKIQNWSSTHRKSFETSRAGVFVIIFRDKPIEIGELLKL